MKIASSLKSLKKRDLNSKLVRRRGRVYIINKKNQKFKARQKQFFYFMIIGSISENKDKEKRISITPDIVKKYIDLGFQILLENDVGSHLGFKDKHYEKEGCQIKNKSEVINNSNIILQLNLPEDRILENLKENISLIGVFYVHENLDKLI